MTLNDNPRVAAEQRRKILSARLNKILKLTQYVPYQRKQRVIVAIHKQISDNEKYLQRFKSDFKYDWSQVVCLQDETNIKGQKSLF